MQSDQTYRHIILFAIILVWWFYPSSVRSEPTGDTTLITLNDALIRAKLQYEEMGINRENMEQARLKRDRAFAAFLPLLTFNTTLIHYDKEIVFGDRIIQRQDALSGEVKAMVPLYSPPLFPAWSKAKATAEASELTLEWQTTLFLFEVSGAYFATLSSQNVVKTAERALLTVQEHLAATEARLEAGEVLSIDVTRARIEVMTLERDLIKARNAFDSAFDYLAFLIRFDGPFRIENPNTTESLKLEENFLLDRALKVRPDLKAQEFTIKASEYACQEARLDYLPDLNLTATYRGTENTGFSGDNFSWNVLLSFDWLLYSGGLRQITRHERNSQLQVSRLHKSLLERSIRLDVQQVLRDVKTARTTLETARSKKDLAQKNQELVLERFKAGLATSLEIIDADEQLRQAEYLVVSEKLNLELTRLEMFRVLGLNPLGKEIVKP